MGSNKNHQVIEIYMLTAITEMWLDVLSKTYFIKDKIFTYTVNLLAY